MCWKTIYHLVKPTWAQGISVFVLSAYSCFVLSSQVSLFVFEDETDCFDLLLSGHLIVNEVIILQVWQIGNLMIISAAHLSFLSHNSAKHSRLSSLGCHPQLVPAMRKIKYQGECYQVILTNKSSTDWRVAENCLYNERPRPSHPLLFKVCCHLSISGVS